MKLSDKRLLACADMVTGSVVCDIGTDHGYLPAYLLSSGRCSRAIAADINPLPLKAAESTLAACNASDKALLCLADGTRGVPLEGVTDIVIAGMGGELIYRILSSDERLLDKSLNFVLQPMTRAPLLRRLLYAGGFEICGERCVREGRFVYCIMRCRYTGISRSIGETAENIGLLDPSLPLDREYILHRINELEKAAKGLSHSDPERSDAMRLTAEKIRRETGIW